MGRKVGAALMPGFRAIMPTLMGRFSACAGNPEAEMPVLKGTVVSTLSVHPPSGLALNLPIAPISRTLPIPFLPQPKVRKVKLSKDFLTNNVCDKH